MAVTTFQQLKESLQDPAIGAPFAAAFSEGYFAIAFGTVGKSEVDQLVFDALVRVGLIDPNGAIYPIARVLKVTPAKARALLFQHQLRNADDAALDRQVLRTLADAKFSVDDKRLSFGVESPLIRTVIDARLKAAGIYSDVSLSGEILKVPVTQLGEFVSVFLDDAAAKALAKRLKVAAGDKGVVDALNGFGKKIAEDLAKAGTKAAAKQGLKEAFEWFANGGVGELADAASEYFNHL